MKIDTIVSEIKNQKGLIIAVIAAGLIFGFIIGRTIKGKEAGEQIDVKTIATSTKDVAEEKTETLLEKKVETKKEVPVVTPVVKKEVALPPVVKKDVAPAPVKTAPVVVAVNTSTLTVTASQNAGSAVTIKNVTTTANSWIAIREDVAGEMGKILGAGWVAKGTNDTTTVELMRSTVSGSKYYAVLYTDNGDKNFSSKTDTPATNNGKIISATFTTK